MTQVTDRLRTAIADRYRIERELGAGGMATVYLAHDVRHNRKVALKVLRPELAAVIGADRFLKEIEVTANLQHPHILPLHDSGEAHAFLFYVMPYIEGESLRHRLGREKQLGVDEAIGIARAVAGALDYAHRHGVIHRDIKPENILLHDGNPVVADFGIALAVSHAGGSRLTETGLSIGTPHYMSPEQAMGDRELDARSDVYSLGAMLYEMLVGEPPFTGPTAQAIVAKVITEKPPLVTVARDTVPPQVAAAIHKALAKLPADRFPTAAAFADALGRPLGLGVDRVSTDVPVAERRPVLTAPRIMWGLAAALVVMTTVAGWALLRPPNLPVVRLAVGLNEAQRIVYGGINLTPPRVAITPDGSTLIYAGASRTQTGVAPRVALRPGQSTAAQVTIGVGSQLWMRPLRELEARPLSGTENGWAPAVSPDGRQLVFTMFEETRTEIKVAALSGGPPLTVVASGIGSAASWGPDDYVYFVDASGLSIRRVAASGGPVETVTTLSGFPGGARLLWSTVLPGGRGAIATVGLPAQGRLGNHELHAVDFASATSERLVNGVYGVYSPSGHLLYVTADGVLMAVGFDPRALRLRGRPTALIEGVDFRNNGASDLAVSATGTLVYATPGVNAPEIIVWVDRSGAVIPVDPGWTGPLEFEALALSPDGSRLAVEMVAAGLGRGDVWIKQLPRGPLSRLTFEGTDNRVPAWSPDGRSVIYLSRAESGAWELLRRRADGSGTPERLPVPDREIHEVVWSRDGAWLLASVSGPPSDDILARRASGDTGWMAVVEGPADEYEPALAPDGRWLAYVSDESGQPEIYVRPFPSTASGKWQISTDGGIEPAWSADSRELYYRSLDGLTLWAASLAGGPSAAVRTAAVRLPEGNLVYEANPRNRLYALTPDGRRFVMINQTGEGDMSGDLVFVQNFFAELRAKVGK